MFFKQIEKEFWNSAHGPINFIDFEKEKLSELRDKYTAMGCIVVITNNAKFGTLTHLDTEADIEKFIFCLDNLLVEHKKDSMVVLVGGNDKPESKAFLKALKQALSTNHYRLYREETGGSPRINRHVTLSQDKIKIKSHTSRNDLSLQELAFDDSDLPDLRIG